MHLLQRSHALQPIRRFIGQRLLTQGVTGTQDFELTNHVKKEIEAHWRTEVSRGTFDNTKPDNKFYVLSMFPYPSGTLHMGHVRVYTIADTVARFQRMCGKNVFQPIGWDAFGLPAENAAIERTIEPAAWTAENIQQMKQQLQALSCSFDWDHELSTCQPEYYKWTQKLFLMLYKDGLAYQNESLVNWDPVDKTVLADEQVDGNNCSWRSGAKVEKKQLKQWFFRTSVFAKRLLDGLDDPILCDWKDIINLQRHWLGDCDGYAFKLMTSAGTALRIWTPNPEYFKDPYAFLVLKSSHFLAENRATLLVENPFARTMLSVTIRDIAEFPDNCEVYLGSPSYSETDVQLRMELGMSEAPEIQLQKPNIAKAEVLEAAIRLNIGGYPVSSKLQDWLISRQRHWGTPIPIIHCVQCGHVPVPDDQLPVLLPDKQLLLENRQAALNCTCPKCGNKNAQRETDTMDTFVDSSWYYLRYLDAKNSKEIFDKSKVGNFMPVDLYIGGKEHAVLHLYYARFMNQYLYSRNLVPTSEPFSRLLVQGMVMGRSYKIKKTGRYVTEAEVEILNAKKNQAILRETKEQVVMNWEKMSKSKYNGVNPIDMFNEYGTDTTRLIILGDVAPTSHRNWSNATFPGLLNWQKRLWLTINDFQEARQKITESEKESLKQEEVEDWEEKLFDARNYYIKGVTFNYRHTYQLSVAISKMQGLTNSLRRTPKTLIGHLKQYEHALACQIKMLAPMAPHFASEMWSRFIDTPDRLNTTTTEWHWDKDVLQQSWPQIDEDYLLDLTIKVNGFENCALKIPRKHIDKVTHNDAMDLAFNTSSVTEFLTGKKIGITNFVLYPGLEAILNIYVDRTLVKEKIVDKTNQDEKIAK